MANTPTVVIGSLNDEELKKSIDKLVNHVDQQLNYMVSSTKVAVMSMNKSLKSLGDTKIDFGGSADGGASKRAKAQNAETVAVKESTQAYKEKTMTLDQRASAINTAIQSEKKYTDEIRNQAAAIRATKEWREKGRYWLDGTQLIDPSVYKGTRAERQAQGTLEEQLLRIQQRLTEESVRQAQSSRQYAENIRQAAQELRGLMTGKHGANSIDVGGRTIYRDTADVTIEQQLTSLVSERGREFNLQRAVTEAIADNEKRISEELQKEVENERKINNERQNRINTKSADFWNNAERENIVSILAQRNQIDRSRVKNWDEETSSIQTLSSALKQYQTAYQRLTAEQRNSNVGKQLIADMQVIERSIQKARAELSRPIDLESVMRLPQKTLDDIAYKMQRLRAYKQGIDLTKPNASNEIKQVDEALVKLQKDADKWMSKSQEMIKSNTALGRSWNYMKNRLAFYFTVGASTQFVKNLIDIRSQYEMNERALGILINSAERGGQIFQELSQMALVSPYTLIELSSAAKQLTAYDIAAKDVVDTTRRLADMASAVGVPMERLTYALGQIKAYGYLNSRDARMFANAGIPLVKQLADYYTQLEGKMVSVGDVYDRMKKKAIDFNSVMAVINNMTDEGGKFFDFQAKMADTLKVRLANLTLAWNNMLNDIGASEQGILTSGIGLLKTFFANWKSINNVLEDVAITFGAVKAAHLAYYAVVLNTNKAIAIETVLGTRLSNIMRNLASTMNTVLTSGATWWSLLAVAAGSAIVEVLRGNEAMKDFNKTLRQNAENTYNDLAKFQEQYSKLRNSLYETRKENGKTITAPKDIDSDEAKKAWEAVREQIELSSRASDQYIGRLLSIQNVSERLRQGFAVIDSIQNVSAALKELGDDAIKLERDWAGWWNLWTFPDGTIGNLKDTHMWLSKINDEFGSLQNAKALYSTDTLDNGLENLFKDRAAEYVERYEEELARFRNDIETTKQSVIDFINLKGWSGDTNKINEVFKQVTENLVLKNQLDPQQAYTLQLEMENARSKAAKEAQYIRLKDLSDAYAAEKDKQHKEEILQEFEKEKEIYENWSTFNGQSKVEWERFTKWLKEQHISETTAMFRDMDAEQISSLNFQEGNYNDWVVRMVTKYAKEHKMSYDDAFKYLKGWVTSANQWSIYIPLIISTEDKKTVFQQLEEYDKAVDAADEKIARLTKRIGELKKKKEKDKEETKELADAEKELAAAQKDKADAKSKGGHGKKEKKDAAAARKAQKAAESELQKTLKEELQLIDQVRSSYDKLTKAGVGHFEAIEASTQGFDRSVKNINKVLNKYGIALDLSKFAGTTNPHELVEMLQKQIDVLMKSPNAKPAEIQDLEVKVQKLGLDVKEFDHKKFTDSLNNELGRLKDEYELAVMLDADPEMGNMFADMIGININDLPRTVKEYADLYTKYLNEYLSKTDAGFQLDNLDLTNDSLRVLEERVKEGTLTQAAYEAIAKAVQDVRDKRKKDFEETTKEFNALIKKYGEYQAKIEEVRQTADKERLTFVKTYGGEEEIKQAIQLTTEIGAEKDPTKKEQLRQQLIALVNQLAGDDATRLKLRVAIDTQQARGEAGVDFEEFQKSPEWIVATGDLAGMTNKAIGGLIDSLERYKKKSKNLDPKQIKQINSALKTLYRQQRSNNPFNVIGNAIMEAKERAAAFEPRIKEVKAEMDKITQDIAKGTATETQKKRLDELIKEYDDLNDKQQQAGKISATTVVDGINSAISAAQTATSMFNQMAEALGGKGMTDAAKTVNRVVNTLQMAGSGAAAGAQIGGGWGAAIGAVVGGLAGVITNWADVWSGNADITDSIERSAYWVRVLAREYKNLEYQLDKAAGTSEMYYQHLIALNKQAQLAELRRQLELEESRKSKNRDQDTIDSLKDQIDDLEREIKDTIDNIVNDFLGISSVGDAAESMMDAFIGALRNGEDAMAAFDESIDDMIANMIKKMFVTKILQPWLDEQWNAIQESINSRSKSTREGLATLYDSLSKLEQSDMDEVMLKGVYVPKNQAIDYIKQRIAEYEKRLAEETTPTLEDIEHYAELLRSGRGTIEEWYDYMNGVIGDLGLMTDSGIDKNLSALQQGIQGITEQTAGALEAYMNGVSQQVYLQSTLLTQIVQTLQMFDVDVQTSTLGGILLQLQQSYQIQQSIQSILSGWSTPSGLAVRVEMT